MKKGVSSSFLASTSLKGEGELDLFYGLDVARGRGGLICYMASTSLKGEEGLSHLYWVSTLEERPALGVLGVSKHLGQKSRFGAHAHGEVYTTVSYRPWSVSNTKAT